MRLSHLQKLFLDQIWGGERVTPPIWIKGKARSEAAARLEIYRRSYQGRTLGLLSDYFPHCARALGTSRFAALAKRFGSAQHARSPLLAAWSGEFVTFLRKARQPRWLIHLATLEWEMERPEPIKRLPFGSSKKVVRSPGTLLGKWESRAVVQVVSHHSETVPSARSSRLQDCLLVRRSASGSTQARLWALTRQQAKLLAWLGKSRSWSSTAAYCDSLGMSPSEVETFFREAVERSWIRTLKD